MLSKIVLLPYKNFKDKVRKVRHFEDKYHIENISEIDSTRGFLYMERRKKNYGKPKY